MLNSGVVRSAAFSPDAKRIVTAGIDNAARIWDSASGEEVRVLGGHGEFSFLYSAAFSPDGSRIATASGGDFTASIWSAVSGGEIAILRGHGQVVRSAAFSPDGSRIVTASEDKTARIWDAVTGKEIAVLHGYEGSLNAAAFSPDASRIVEAADDRTASIWDVHIATTSTKDVIVEVCHRLRSITTLSRDEMQLAGYADDIRQIDVCAGIE